MGGGEREKERNRAEKNSRNHQSNSVGFIGYNGKYIEIGNLMGTTMVSVGLDWKCVGFCWWDVLWRMGNYRTLLNPTGIDPKTH